MPAAARSNGANAAVEISATWASSAVGRASAGMPAAYSAAYLPARRPKTSRSPRELPPSRFDPCMPAAHSPAANRPGRVAAAVSGSTFTPPIT
jgi:hypothetical protein